MPPTHRILDLSRDIYSPNRLSSTAILARLRPHICPFEPLVDAVPQGSSILDVGCGSGLFVALLARLGFIRAGHGIDSNRKAIAVAKQIRENLPAAVDIRFDCRSAEESWGEPNSYDVVSLIDVMHHIDPAYQKKPIELAAEVLRPGGRLLYKDMANRPYWLAAANRLHDLILARQWIRYVSLDDIIRWAEGNGFRTLEVQRFRRYWYAHEMVVFEKKDGVSG